MGIFFYIWKEVLHSSFKSSTWNHLSVKHSSSHMTTNLNMGRLQPQLIPLPLTSGQDL